MLIYIDESGSFVNPSNKPNVISVVGGMAVSEGQVDSLLDGFKRLKMDWGLGESELKGSKANEAQVAQAIDLAKKHDVILTVIATDLGAFDLSDLPRHKASQANVFRSSAIDVVHDHFRVELNKLADAIDHLPNQLYIQSVMMTLLISEMLRGMTLYQCQREPKSLSNFHWVIDAKDKSPTAYEKLWREICMPFLQTISIAEPLIQIREGDYSAFEKYCRDYDSPPEHLAEHLPPEKQGKRFSTIDVRALMKETRFEDSANNLGLQLADILVTATRRAFSLTLQIQGWQSLGKLMLQQVKGKDAVQFISLVNQPSDGKVTTPYGGIVSHFTRTARSPFR